MKTIELKIYNFNELSNEAKNKAITKQREYEYKWGEPLYFFKDTCKDKIEKAGFEDIIIEYSLNNSQGDGLSFSAGNYNKLELLYLDILGKGKEKTAKLLAENTTIQLTGNRGNYTYAHSNQVDLYFENQTSSINCIDISNIEDIQGQVLNKLSTIYMGLCGELEKEGYLEIQYYFSDENIINMIEDNDYEFLEDGKVFAQ